MSEIPQPTPENQKKMSRRQFMKWGAKATGIVVGSAALGELGVDANKVSAQRELEPKPEVERVGLIEGMQNPVKLLDQFAENIIKNNAETGEGYKNFLENFSEVHSSTPDIARANREALDYAFRERQLGNRIISAVDTQLEPLYPDLETEERLKHTIGGENATLQEVVQMFVSIERRSKSEDITKHDSGYFYDKLKYVTDWVRPMNEHRNYDAERRVYAERAIQLNEQNNLYQNTKEAWAQKSPEVQQAVMQTLDIQEKYFPIATAGIGVIRPGDFPFHSANNTRVEEITLALNFETANEVDHQLTQLIHEESHQFQEDSLDFDLLQVLHPEDFLENYEVHNDTTKLFRTRISQMDAYDINLIAYDPGLQIKFSDIQVIRTEADVRRVQLEMQTVREIASFFEERNSHLIEKVGMEYSFVKDGKRMEGPDATAAPDAITTDYIDVLDNLVSQTPTNPDVGRIQGEIMKIHSANILNSYAVLSKLQEAGVLSDYKDLFPKYSTLKNIVEKQVLHATQGPVGSYLRPGEVVANLSTDQLELAERNKALAQEARERSPHTSLAVAELVNNLYDRVPKHMDAQARLWGGNGIEDYPKFANEVLEQIL